MGLGPTLPLAGKVDEAWLQSDDAEAELGVTSMAWTPTPARIVPTLPTRGMVGARPYDVEPTTPSTR